MQLAELMQTTDIEAAIAKENSLPPGLYEIRIYTVSPMGQDSLNQLHNHLLDQGVDVRGLLEQTDEGLWQVRIRYCRHSSSGKIAFAGLAVIPLVVPLAIVALIGVGIFKIESVARAVTPLVIGIGAIGIALIYLMGKSGRSEAISAVSQRMRG